MENAETIINGLELLVSNIDNESDVIDYIKSTNKLRHVPASEHIETLIPKINQCYTLKEYCGLRQKIVKDENKKAGYCKTINTFLVLHNNSLYKVVNPDNTYKVMLDFYTDFMDANISYFDWVHHYVAYRVHIFRIK